MDYDLLETQGYSSSEAFDTMKSRGGWYDPKILQAFVEIRTAHIPKPPEQTVLEFSIHELQAGMVLFEGIKMINGRLLVSRGHEITLELIERLLNYKARKHIVEPIQVLQKKEESVPENS